MLKLKKIIAHLDTELYLELENNLIATKAENFLFLLQSYKNTDLKDDEIAKRLKITINSLYVLKSRLNDKIQERFLGNIFSSREGVLQQLHRVPELLFDFPSEVAESHLLKLQKDLLDHDLHSELLVVYSALKKLHLNSDKYFYFSQLYNQHVAFYLSIEKAEEILGNFNMVLEQYDFSRSDKSIETLRFLMEKIENHFKMKPSRQTEIIRNIACLQFVIFVDQKNPEGQNVEEKLIQTRNMIFGLPACSEYKKWEGAVKYLFFEYYRKSGHHDLAFPYFEELTTSVKTLLLLGRVCLTSRFLISKRNFEDHVSYLSKGQMSGSELFINPHDTHGRVLVSLNEAVEYFKHGNYKEAAKILNEVLNESNFKDSFHINLEMKLTLAFAYIKSGNFYMAETILKNLKRKIKAEEMQNYSQVLILIKLLQSSLKKHLLTKEKQSDLLTLFIAKNKGRFQILEHLLADLNATYNA